ncbi:hypothetical protein DDB_G0293074 [Dictyostelium discoideum AX4]|uniref:Amino acid transporter transmembrane domain-containing protein n=1 Tax=Dictyostelium discoideum TaxID=44689 RepID=Q54CB3_DICDI|nr:hypothetical protein DDB_G0293074 [Dictyostelium discoideum AX4]EAL60889.1 hypothetical protein DDB_G0293074 [Dictyostelium discoideum AX4]|eukprot:XP_629306.1 hypothetical protein DDB_G0293074 [Dictyostelium discoideum AX4]
MAYNSRNSSSNSQGGGGMIIGNNNNNGVINRHSSESTPLINNETYEVEKKYAPIPSFWNTVKAFAGAGSFALPGAMTHAGLWIGSIGLVLISILSNYTMNILLKCSIQMTQDRIGPEKPSYADIAQRAFGRVGELFVCFMNFLVTMSICVSYLILIGQNIDYFTKIGYIPMIWIVLPFILLLTFLTDMKYLGFTSIFGALSLILAMFTIVIYGIKDNHVHPLSDYTFDFKQIPLWFGNAAFFFCNHIVVIPVSHASGDNKRYPNVLNFAMIFITVINVAFAVLCYLYYNFISGGIPSAIVDVLPNGIFANIVKVCVVLELSCSFPLIFAAGLNVVDSSIQIFHHHFNAFPELDGSSVKTPFFSRNWKFYLIRIVFCSMLAGIASAVTNFGNYTSLIGSLMLAVAGFVVPPLLSLRFFPQQAIPWKVFHITITIFGIMATILGTYLSIKAFVDPSN